MTFIVTFIFKLFLMTIINMCRRLFEGPKRSFPAVDMKIIRFAICTDVTCIIHKRNIFPNCSLILAGSELNAFTLE